MATREAERISGGESSAPAGPASDLELFIFRELPGELRYLLAVSAELPDVVAYAANGVQLVLGELAGDSPPRQLQRSAVQLRGYAEQIHRAASDMLVLAGRLQGLAWASWAGEEAEGKGDRPQASIDGARR